MMKNLLKRNRTRGRVVRSFASAVGVLFFATTPLTSPAQSIPQGTISVRLEQFGETLGTGVSAAPLDFTPLNDSRGRNVVVSIGGSSRLLDASGATLGTGSFLPSVAEFARGSAVTGIAAHPDYINNGKIYAVTNGDPVLGVDFNVTPTTSFGFSSQVIELTADDPASDSPTFTSRALLRVAQPDGAHNLTDLAFDRDGLLYVTVGDGGPAGTDTAVAARAQNLTNIYGSVIRIDPLNTSGPGLITSANQQYGIPTSNIGFDNDTSSGTVDEIYAFGLRSPYRLNFDRLTDRLYLGDVGSQRFEEVNLIEDGGNYGWGRFEGEADNDLSISLASENPTHSLPTFTYGRDTLGSVGDGETVVGGFVYRGSGIPELSGKYIFADFGLQVTGSQDGSPARVFYADLDSDGEFVDGSVRELLFDPSGEQIVTTDPSEITIAGAVNGQTRSFVYSIGEDRDGELYLLVGENFPSPALALDNRSRILRLTSIPEPGAAALVAVCLWGMLGGCNRAARRSH